MLPVWRLGVHVGTHARLCTCVPQLTPSAPQQKRRLEDLEELCFALRGRIDEIEEATGSVIGPAFSRSHAKRISTLERRVFGYSPP